MSRRGVLFALVFTLVSSVARADEARIWSFSPFAVGDGATACNGVTKSFRIQVPAPMKVKKVEISFQSSDGAGGEFAVWVIRSSVFELLFSAGAYGYPHAAHGLMKDELQLSPDWYSLGIGEWLEVRYVCIPFWWDPASSASRVWFPGLLIMWTAP